MVDFQKSEKQQKTHFIFLVERRADFQEKIRKVRNTKKTHLNLATIVWDDGTTYVGACVDGYLTGEGILKMSDGVVYEGSFKNGLAEGQGKISFYSFPDLFFFSRENYGRVWEYL